MSGYEEKYLSRPALRDLPTSLSEFKESLINRHRRECIITQPRNINPRQSKGSDDDFSVNYHESKADVMEHQEQGLSNDKYWAILTTGAGLFSDGYINNSISSVSSCLKSIYGKKYTDSLAIQHISSIVFVGTVVGQLVFGFLSDHYSRKKSMLIGTTMLIVFTILCSGAWGKATSGTEPGGLFAALTAWRFFLGIAVGSEYSSGSPAAAEASNMLPSGKRNRWFMWFTNFAIDSGFVLGAFVPLIVLWICGDKHLTPVWRISIGLGAIPPISLFFLRLQYKESKKFQETRFNHGLPYIRIIKFYWLRTSVIALIWFLYDFSSYGFGTYSSIIIGLVLPEDASLYQNFGWNVVLNLFYIPGAFLGGYSADYFGPRLSLTVGLIVQAAIGYGLAGGLDHLKQHIAGFVVMYGVFMTLGEFSAGNNTLCIASKIHATPVRGTLYGIAAMIGKVGAFVGSWVFPTIIRDNGLPATYWVCSTLCLFSAFLAYFLLPDLDQEAMDREDERFLTYLHETGYDMSQMGFGVSKDVNIEDTNVEMFPSGDSEEADDADSKKLRQVVTVEER